MIEETIRFGRSGHLIGTLTRPVTRPPGGLPQVVALLTNAGVISRMGPRRINVRIAHRLAAEGIPSFRWDLSGLGDSGRSPEEGAAGEQFLLDTQDAMDKAAEMFGVQAFVMIGFCSGAQVGFRTALRDERLRGLVLFDHFKFPTFRSNLRWYARRLKVIGPSGLVPAICRGVARRIQSLTESFRRRKERALHSAELADPSHAEYSRLLLLLIRRGVQLLFVYSGSFARTHNYSGQFDDLYRRYGIPEYVESVYLPNADHLITPAKEQVRLIDLVVVWVRAKSRAMTAGGRSAQVEGSGGIDPSPIEGTAAAREGLPA